jgi:segregation and condensation protein B
VGKKGNGVKKSPDRRLEPAAEPGEFPAPAPDDRGISLEDLSQAYAQLLDSGHDPYEKIAPEETLPEWQDEEGDAESPAAEVEAEVDHQAACSITPRSILEAMLFIGHPGNEPLTADKVASLMRGVRPREIHDLVLELNEIYDAEGCPYFVESIGAGYRLSLREEFGALRDKFYGRIKAAKLSQAVIDVLAIVAYKQPVTREEVDQLRGRPSGGILNQLVRRQLLRVDRPREKPRVPRFSTTERFQQLFGLESLKDLPKSPD